MPCNGDLVSQIVENPRLHAIRLPESAGARDPHCLSIGKLLMHNQTETARGRSAEAVARPGRPLRSATKIANCQGGARRSPLIAPPRLRLPTQSNTYPHAMRPAAHSGNRCPGVLTTFRAVLV